MPVAPGYVAPDVTSARGLGITPATSVMSCVGLRPLSGSSSIRFWSTTVFSVLDVVEDPFGDSARSAEVAGMLGAQLTRVEGTGHFWPYSGVDVAVPALEAFWAGLD